MKQLIILCITLSFYSLILAQVPEEDYITGAETVQMDNSEQTVTLTCADNSFQVGDKIVISLASYSDNIASADNTITVKTGETCPAGKVKLVAEGSYNIYLIKTTPSPPLKLTPPTQKIKQKVVSEITLASITSIELSTEKVEVNKSVTITLNFDAHTLMANDEIIFSIGETDPSTEPGKTKNYKVATNFDSELKVISPSITFTTAGTYNIWIQRGSEKTKQTNNSVKIQVAASSTEEDKPTDKPTEEEKPTDKPTNDEEDSSDWINISFVILIGVLLL